MAEVPGSMLDIIIFFHVVMLLMPCFHYCEFSVFVKVSCVLLLIDDLVVNKCCVNP